MRRKIFFSIIFVALAMQLVSLGIAVPLLYRHLTEEQFQRIRSEVALVGMGVERNGLDYLETLEGVDFRVTWITPEGAILYDSEVSSAVMENHLSREEIVDALANGCGESSRYSDTLSERRLYTARRLDDGSVLRLSINQMTILYLLGQYSLPLLGVTAVGLVVAFAIASLLSSKIVQPINELNLDEPMGNTAYDVYTEIKPLILRLEQQHRQLERDKKELEKTSLIRQEFTANASHELKTPLHVISGYAELLENGLVKEDDAHHFAALIHKESQRMSKLVEDIIDLSFLDSGAVGVTRERTDLYRIAQNAVDSLEKTADDAGITVTLQGEHAEMNGIPQVLYGLVYNLVLNAITYSDRGTSVKVSVTRGDHGIRLTVLDHGIGIPLEEQGRIFERFYRVDKSRSKDVGGTGLGLSIVKHAAHIHSAEIKLQSAPGKGSAFTVYFPVDESPEK